MGEIPLGQYSCKKKKKKMLVFGHKKHRCRFYGRNTLVKMVCWCLGKNKYRWKCYERNARVKIVCKCLSNMATGCSVVLGWPVLNTTLTFTWSVAHIKQRQAHKGLRELHSSVIFHGREIISVIYANFFFYSVFDEHARLSFMELCICHGFGGQ